MLRISLFFLAFAPLLQAQQPNIVIFFSDDHTNQAISAYQDLPDAAPQDALFKDWAVAETPGIDRLADQGLVFRGSYVNNSICSPSRANLLTGLHSHANGVLDNSRPFDGSQQTFPKLLQSAGYNTAIFGKWHLKSTPTGFDQYEVLSGYNGQGSYYGPVLSTPGGNVTYAGQYVADVTTGRALNWLQARIDSSASDPFLMFVNHKGTHRVWQPGPQETDPAVFRPVEWDYSVTPNPDTAPGDSASWTPATVPVPPNFDDRLTDYATRASGARAQSMEVATDLRLNVDLKLENTSFGGIAYDEVRTWWNANKGSMSAAEKHAYYLQRYLKDYMLTGKAVDRGVGDVLDFLEANDLDHNTIIIYASDQGFFLGEHGWYDKRWMYTESFRTPLIIQWKDASGNPVTPTGAVAEEMVQVMDIGPTVLDAAGVSPTNPMHGSSFLGYLTAATGDEPVTWQDSLYYHYHEGARAVHNVQKHYGVFDGRYKLINHYELNSGQQWELFDLENDPLEMNNLLYNSTTGIIDNPEDGIEGDESFQTLVRDLMVELSDLRTRFNDNTGTNFSIPGIFPAQ
jgi:arylsulfatase A-like enzyme